MAGGKHVRERLTGLPGPFFVPRRHFGGDDDATGAEVGLQHFADQAFAVSVPVRQCGIKEPDPSVHCFAQGLTSCAVIAAAPLGAAQSPATEAELADDIPRGTEDSSLHRRPPESRTILTDPPAPAAAPPVSPSPTCRARSSRADSGARDRAHDVGSY